MGNLPGIASTHPDGPVTVAQHSRLLRIVNEGWRLRRGIHQFLDFVGDALSRLAKLVDSPVVGMAGGDPPDRCAVE